MKKCGRTNWRAMAASVMVLAIVVACGDSGDDATTTDLPAEEGDEQTAEGESDDGEPSNGLEIDGEVIADAELWEAAQEEGGLVLYTAVTELRMQAILDRFEEETGLSADMVRVPGGRLSERILSEHASDILEADAIMQSDYTLALAQFEAGVFAPHCPPAWDDLKEEGREADCHYWPSLDAIYVIIYNTELVAEEDAPQSWDDLLEPEWTGELNMPYIGVGGSTWARDLWLRKEKGIEYWEALATQDVSLTGSAGTTVEDVVRGERPVGSAVQGTAGNAIADGAPLAIVLPSDGVPAYSQWTGLASGAANENAGKVYLNWLASRAGQTAVAEASGDFPVRYDVDGPTIAGEQYPPANEAGFVYPELDPDYVDMREEWQAEWLDIFGYTPS